VKAHKCYRYVLLHLDLSFYEQMNVVILFPILTSLNGKSRSKKIFKYIFFFISVIRYVNDEMLP